MMNQKLRRIQAKLGKAYIIVAVLILSLVILAVGYSSVQPKQYHFNLNQVAELTIRAPKTLEDTQRTLEAQQRARDAVPDVYLFQPDIMEQQSAKLDGFFNFMRHIRAGSYPATIQSSSQIPKGLQPFLALDNRQQREIYQQEVQKASDIIKRLNDSVSLTSIMILLTLEENKFDTMESFAKNLLLSTLSTEFDTGQISAVLKRLDQEVEREPSMQGIAFSVENLLHELVIPTVAYSQSETLARQKVAASNVPPSYILQGQVIVQEGHVIDSNIMRQLSLFGYLDAQTQRVLSYMFYWVVFIHGILIVCLFTNWFKFDTLNMEEANMQVTAYSIAFAFVFLMFKLCENMQTSGIAYATLLCPVCFVPLLIVPKVNLKMGIVAVIFFNLFGLFLLNDVSNLLTMLLPALFFFFSSLIGLFVVDERVTTHLRKEMLYKSISWHMFLLFPLLLSLNMDIVSSLTIRVLSFVLGSLVVSHVVLLLIWSYWDQLLSDRAILTLNQLANLNHPLLKLLIEKAPGSYHHSMMVANLSANAVEAIGGDSLLTRVASYYHDIGKTVHPLFFVENLPAGLESPHKMITPYESATIIMEHVTEGVKLLEKYNMPKSIVDICRQHHGTTLVKYFYSKAKKKNKEISESEFRYSGGIPKTKEAAIIMIADSVEAASRTLKDYSQQSIESLVNQIVADKIKDNQLAQCELTVQELQIVKRSLVKGIASMYHTRVEYPKD